MASKISWFGWSMIEMRLNEFIFQWIEMTHVFEIPSPPLLFQFHGQWTDPLFDWVNTHGICLYVSFESFQNQHIHWHSNHFHANGKSIPLKSKWHSWTLSFNFILSQFKRDGTGTCIDSFFTSFWLNLKCLQCHVLKISLFGNDEEKVKKRHLHWPFHPIPIQMRLPIHGSINPFTKWFVHISGFRKYFKYLSNILTIIWIWKSQKGILNISGHCTVFSRDLKCIESFFNLSGFTRSIFNIDTGNCN